MFVGRVGGHGGDAGGMSWMNEVFTHLQAIVLGYEWLIHSRQLLSVTGISDLQ